MHETQPSFQNLTQEKIQDETYIRQKAMEAIIDADGGHITWMTSGSAKKREWFLWDFQVKFDMKGVWTIGKLMIMFVFVNCPRIKNKLFHLTIDNFFRSTY